MKKFTRVDGSYLYENRLPSIYLGEDAKQKPAPFPLKRYLQITDVGFDYVNDKIEGLMNLYDIDNCPPEFLPYLADMLGFEFPYEMTDIEKRQWIKLLPTLYKFKGTKSLFNYLGRVVYGADTTVSATRYGRTVEDPFNNIELKVSIDGDTRNITDLTDKYRRFADKFRPVNHRLDVLISLIYYDIFDKMRMRDDSEKFILKDNLNTESYDRDRMTELYDFYKLKSADTEIYLPTSIIETNFDLLDDSFTDDYSVQPIEREEITIIKHVESDVYDTTKFAESTKELLRGIDAEVYNGISEETSLDDLLFVDSEVYGKNFADSSFDSVYTVGSVLNGVNTSSLLNSFVLNSKPTSVTLPVNNN